MQWRYLLDGEMQGPVDDSAMVELARQGVIREDTLTMHEQAAEWQPWGVARSAIAANVGRSAVIPGARAIVTPVLVGINVLVFIAMVVSGVGLMEPKIADLLRWGADFGPLTTQGQWWRMLTSIFVHIGVIHILMNMFVLFSAGPVVERIFGSVSFAVLYILAGLGGSLASLAWRPDGVSAGASGAVFGIFGGLLGFLALHRHSVDPQAVKALGKYAGTFLIYNVVYGAMQSHIDMAAHLGGLVTGFVMGMALAMPFAENTARLRRAAIAGVAGLALIAFGASRLNARIVVIGKNDEVKYTSRVERKDAEALGQYLQKSGFFSDKGVRIELSRGAEGQEVSIVMKEGAWDNPAYLQGVDEIFGPDLATEVTGVPLTINLLDNDGKVRRSLKIHRRVVHVGKNDRVYYEGSATREDAEALGRALKEKQFFLDTGRAMSIIKNDGRKILELRVNEKAYGDPNYEKFARNFGRELAPVMGGTPLTMRLVKPRNYLEEVAGAAARWKDIVVP